LCCVAIRLPWGRLGTNCCLCCCLVAANHLR
jgi:hypothetical protein